MTLFERMILGHYLNKKQAQSNPTKWPTINILYTKVAPLTLEMKSWYNYQGEDNPYRHFQVDLTYENDVTVFTQSTNLLTNEPSCSWKFGYFDGWWFGELDGDCILRNTKVVSEVQFNGQIYKSLDTGYDAETGKFAWGKLPEEGMFEFVRLNNARTSDYTLTDNVRNED